MNDRKHERMDELPGALRRATELLREAPEPGDLWRHRLAREIERARAPLVATATPERRWSLRPWTAVAAGLLCMVLGGGAVALWQGGATSTPGRSPQASFATTSASPTSVRFTLEAPAAASVALVGDFNGWNPQALPMRRAADGRSWEVEVPLAPGRYTYSFVVDGIVASDPRAPRAAGDDFGAPSSVVLVRGS